MRVRFWGTRGSIPTPGPTTLRYGGNTSCVEVRAADGTLVVLDCGTGAHGLGRALVSGTPSPLHGHLLIGHTHWDHIQGFPFFAPLFVPANVWEIYAPGGHGGQIEASLAGQMAYEYFPIRLTTLAATVRLHDLTEGVFEIGSVRVTTQYLHHPSLTLGYRLEADGATLVYATDHEPHALHPLRALPGTVPVHQEDQRHIRFLEGADLLIHDAQYTLNEFPAKEGWGHTPMERDVDYAVLAQANQLALFHHDPDRSDAAVDRLCARARDRVASTGSALQVFAAAEGQVLALPQGPPRQRPSVVPAASALRALAPRGASTVLIVDDDPEMVRGLETELHAEGVRVLQATHGEAALRLARHAHPTLILLDLSLPGIDGLAVCRILRADPDPHLRTVHIGLTGG